MKNSASSWSAAESAFWQSRTLDSAFAGMTDSPSVPTKPVYTLSGTTKGARYSRVSKRSASLSFTNFSLLAVEYQGSASAIGDVAQMAHRGRPVTFFDVRVQVFHLA